MIGSWKRCFFGFDSYQIIGFQIKGEGTSDAEVPQLHLEIALSEIGATPKEQGLKAKALYEFLGCATQIETLKNQAALDQL